MDYRQAVRGNGLPPGGSSRSVARVNGFPGKKKASRVKEVRKPLEAAEK